MPDRDPTRRRVACLVALAVAALGARAGAQAQPDRAAAETLFQEGKRLLDAGRAAEACPKFEASQRLDPGIGTLLYQSECYERVGRTASAWASFLEAAAVARRAGDGAREQLARERAASVEKRLSRVTIRFADGADLPGLVVRRDGVAVDRALIGTPVPVDPGSHRVEAAAPGRRRWTAVVTVRSDQRSVDVAVPRLEESTVGDAPATSDAPQASGGRSPLRSWALVAGGAGVVATGVGAWFGLRARSLDRDSRSDCEGNACGPDGKASRLDALSAARVSTVAFVAGGVLLATGATLWVVGAPAKAPVTSVGIGPAPAGAGAGLEGRFP